MNEEIINKALELRMTDLSKKENVVILANAYREMFGKELCVTCGGDIRNAYYKINSHMKNPNVMKLDGAKATKYKLKQGVILIHPETSAMYSNMNLTDEVAEEILSLIPQCSVRFEKLPKQEISVEQIQPVEATEIKKPRGKKKKK
jgi:hypothetical protein